MKETKALHRIKGILIDLEPELIEKFFRKECTPQEAKKVAFYLKANPSILEKYLNEYEWTNAQLNKIFPDEFWNDAWKNIQQKNKAQSFSIILKRTMAAAASVVVLILAVYYLFPSNKKTDATIASKVIMPDNKPQQKFIINTTNKLLSVVLEDSSVIKLSPASSVHYPVPFEKNKRDIYLDGEAYFKVSKNKLRPFTVYAAGLSTTALGTSFTIKTNKKANTIYVKLFTGKIVIKEVKDFTAWTKDVYLLPGMQMQFDENNMLVKVGKIPNNNTIKAIVSSEKNSLNKGSSNTALSFNNSKLTEVFNKISNYYNVKIEYDTALVDTINFTGIVMKNDSLPVILNIITHMNNLEVFKNENEYRISKREQ